MNLSSAGKGSGIRGRALRTRLTGGSIGRTGSHALENRRRLFVLRNNFTTPCRFGAGKGDPCRGPAFEKGEDARNGGHATGSLRTLRMTRDGERPFWAPHTARAARPVGQGGSFSRTEGRSPPSAPGAPVSRGIHREGGSRVEGSLPCAGACSTATGLKRAPCCGAGCPLRRGSDGLFGRALLRPRVRRAAGVAVDVPRSRNARRAGRKAKRKK